MASANPAATSAPLRNLPPVSSSTVSPPSAPAPSSLRQTSSWPSRSQGTSPPPTAASAHASSRLQHPARLGTAKSPLSRLNHFASWSWKKVASNPTVLITGVIIGVIAAVPTYRAYVIGQWTAWKDYIDYCRNVDMTTLAASKQQDCQRAIDVGLGPPPYTPLHRVKQTVNEMVLRARGVNEPSPPPAPPAYSSWAWTYKLFLALTVVPFVFFTFVMVFTFVSSWLAAGYYVSRQPLWGSVGRYRRVISQAAMSVAVLLGLVWSIQSYFSASKALQTSRENAMQEFLNYCSSVQAGHPQYAKCVEAMSKNGNGGTPKGGSANVLLAVLEDWPLIVGIVSAAVACTSLILALRQLAAMRRMHHSAETDEFQSSEFIEWTPRPVE